MKAGTNHQTEGNLPQTLFSFNLAKTIPFSQLCAGSKHHANPHLKCLDFAL